MFKIFPKYGLKQIILRQIYFKNPKGVPLNLPLSWRFPPPTNAISFLQYFTHRKEKIKDWEKI